MGNANLRGFCLVVGASALLLAGKNWRRLEEWKVWKAIIPLRYWRVRVSRDCGVTPFGRQGDPPLPSGGRRPLISVQNRVGRFSDRMKTGFGESAEIRDQPFPPARFPKRIFLRRDLPKMFAGERNSRKGLIDKAIFSETG